MGLHTIENTGDAEGRSCNARSRKLCPSRRTALIAATILCWIGVAVYLAGTHGSQIGGAMSRMPLEFLILAVVAQIIVVVLRTEAWRLALESAGSEIRRSSLYGAAALAAPLTLVNMQLSAAARIGVLRRLEPRRAPGISTLCAAELPIWGSEVVVGAVLLIFAGPALGLPWFAAPLGLLAIGGILFALGRTSLHSHHRYAAGLHILVDRRRALKLIGIVTLNTLFQVARIWLLLRGAGLGVSPLDATAVLVGQGLLSQLPIGSAGASSASVMIVGGGAAGALATAGLALTATELTAAFCLVLWSATVFVPLLFSRREPMPEAPGAPATLLEA